MGRKRIKGEAAIHDEIKKTTAIVLTPTAVLALDSRAEGLNLSRSELVERIARQEIGMTNEETEHERKLQTITQIINKWTNECTPERRELARWKKVCLLIQEISEVLKQ